MMVDIDRLSSVFQGPFARFGAALAVTPMADDIPVTAYLSIEAIAVHLDGFGQRYPAGSDRRAVASLWSKTYLRGLIPAPMIALVGGVPLDLSPDKGALRADASAVVLGAASGGEAALAGLYAHLDLLAQALKGSTRLAPRVVWSNAANLLTATLERLEAVAPPATAARTRCSIRSVGSRRALRACRKRFDNGAFAACATSLRGSRSVRPAPR